MKKFISDWKKFTLDLKKFVFDSEIFILDIKKFVNDLAIYFWLNKSVFDLDKITVGGGAKLRLISSISRAKRDFAFFQKTDTL